MSRQALRAVGDIGVAEHRSMPAWVPGIILTLSVLLVTNFGYFMYWKGGADRDLGDLVALKKSVADLDKANAALASQVASLTNQRTELSQYTDQLIMWSQEVRNRIITTGRGRSVDIPPVPQRNGRGF